MQAKNETVLDKENIRSEKKKKQEANFYQKKIERIEKLQKEIQALEQEKKNSNLDKDIKILDKEITAIKNTIDKIDQEEYKEQTYIDEQRSTQRQFNAQLDKKKIQKEGQKRKKIEPSTSLKKAKKQGKATVKAAAKEEFFKRTNLKEESKTNTEKEFGISKEDLAQAKKGRSQEV